MTDTLVIINDHVIQFHLGIIAGVACLVASLGILIRGFAKVIAVKKLNA